jgi:putative flavoprotein involved in K+ transport
MREDMQMSERKPETIDTLIIGGGQAGLAMSYQLSQRGHPHLVLERGRVGERWISERWLGMHFQTPNAMVALPGFKLPTEDPTGFGTAAEIAAYLRDYAARFDVPVRTGVAVTKLSRTDAGFTAETSEGPIQAKNVVVATGPYQTPIIPKILPETPGVVQLHANAYHAPESLPPGAVLVVGAGASGAQIADELLRAGRKVYFSVSRHRRTPRRYRGLDHVRWWIETGFDRTPVALKPPSMLPLVHSGAYGGRTVDFREFATRGMVLLGRVESADGNVVRFAGDLLDNLTEGDAGYQAVMDGIDAFIAKTGLDLPPDPEARQLAPEPDGLRDLIRELNLSEADVTSVIWATGYGLDFSWIDIPVFDASGIPRHQAGVTEVEGLYFLGLEWLSTISSAFLVGVGDDANGLATAITGQAQTQDG